VLCEQNWLKVIEKIKALLINEIIKVKGVVSGFYRTPILKPGKTGRV